MDYVIVMDVSGDVDMSVQANSRLKFLPMEYSVGGEMRHCDRPEEPEFLRTFYNGQRNGDLTQTSQISPYLYEQYFTPYFEQGLSVVYLCLSSGLSATFSSACMAGENLQERFPGRKLYPVDTLAATGGMGVLAERALRNQDAGMSAEENYHSLCAGSKKIRHWFVVQDLNYLKRGGRVSAATAVFGTALNIKPVLIIDEIGKLQTLEKKRGLKAACASMVSHFCEEYDPASGDVVYVIDADSQEASDLITDAVREKFPDAVIRHSMLSPIIGAHTGPGMAALCYVSR